MQILGEKYAKRWYGKKRETKATIECSSSDHVIFWSDQASGKLAPGPASLPGVLADEWW